MPTAKFVSDFRSSCLPQEDLDEKSIFGIWGYHHLLNVRVCRAFVATGGKSHNRQCEFARHRLIHFYQNSTNHNKLCPRLPKTETQKIKILNYFSNHHFYIWCHAEAEQVPHMLMFGVRSRNKLTWRVHLCTGADLAGYCPPVVFGWQLA